MAYNGFGGYTSPFMNGNQYLQSYPQTNYQQYNNMNQQNQSNQQSYSSPNDYPFVGVRFVNESEANGMTVLPNTRWLLMDTNNQVFWVKWADAMGKSSMEKYKFDRFEEPKDTKSIANATEIDTTQFVKKEDLSDFIKKEDTESFVTKENLKQLYDRLDSIDKKINVKDILKEDNK